MAERKAVDESPWSGKKVWAAGLILIAVIAVFVVYQGGISSLLEKPAGQFTGMVNGTQPMITNTTSDSVQGAIANVTSSKPVNISVFEGNTKISSMTVYTNATGDFSVNLSSLPYDRTYTVNISYGNYSTMTDITRTALSPIIIISPKCVDGCGDGVCQEVVCLELGCPCAETPTSCPTDCGTCTDSDGGENYYVKGSTTNSTDSYQDQCFIKRYSDSAVQKVSGCNNTDEYSCGTTEYFCSSDTEIGGTANTCPNGCEDGACTPKTIVNCAGSQSSEGYSVGSSIEVTYNDGSKQTFTDGCGVSSGSGQVGLAHYYCGWASDGPHYWKALTSCPNGCIDGACVVSKLEGSGKADYIAKWLSGSSLGNSAIFEKDGNVGIGTTSPTAKLDVNGSIVASGNVIAGGSGSAITVLGGQFFNDGLNNIVLDTYFNGSNLVLSTAPNGVVTERMRITSSGNVGIGTTTPAQKLDVAGYVKGAGICIGDDCRTSWPAGGASMNLTDILIGSGSVTDDNGTVYGYSQYAQPVYVAKTTFAKPLDPASIYGKTIALFGQNYIFGNGATEMSTTTLTLYGGGTEVGLDWPSSYATQSVTIGNKTLSVTLNGIATGGTTADFTIDGTAYNTRSAGSFITTTSGVQVYVKTILLYGQGNQGRVVLKVGAGKIQITNTDFVRTGTNLDAVKGTLGTISTSGGKISQIEIRVDPQQGISNLIGNWPSGGVAASVWSSSGNNTYYNQGNVGIGTTTPGAKLTVAGAGTTGVRIIDTTGNAAYAGWDIRSGQQVDGDFAINQMITAGGSNLRFLINEAGNVGIGMSTPSDTLSVVGSTKFGSGSWPTNLIGRGTSSRLALSGVSGDSYLIFMDNSTVAAGSGAGGIWFGGRISDVNYQYWQLAKIQGLKEDNVNGSKKGYLQFDVADVNGNFKDAMRIASTGNVGIGTTTPTQKLDVAGYVKGTGVCIGNDCRTSWPSGGVAASVWSSSGNNTYYNQGNVGIGTTNPKAKLDVAGTISVPQGVINPPCVGSWQQMSPVWGKTAYVWACS